MNGSPKTDAEQMALKERLAWCRHKPFIIICLCAGNKRRPLVVAGFPGRLRCGLVLASCTHPVVLCTFLLHLVVVRMQSCQQKNHTHKKQTALGGRARMWQDGRLWQAVAGCGRMVACCGMWQNGQDGHAVTRWAGGGRMDIDRLGRLGWQWQAGQALAGWAGGGRLGRLGSLGRRWQHGQAVAEWAGDGKMGRLGKLGRRWQNGQAMVRLTGWASWAGGGRMGRRW